MGGIGLQVTKFKEKDLLPAAELFVAIFNDEPWNDNWQVKTAEKRLTDFLNTPKFLGVCCYEGEELLGFALGNREQWFEGEVFHLKEMGVKREKQGEGLGTSLLEKLRKQLIGTGAKGIYLVTARGTRAEKFYQKNGFKSNEELVVMDGRI